MPSNKATFFFWAQPVRLYKVRFSKAQEGQSSDTRQPTEREIFSFTASKEYVPTTPTSKTDAPICVVEGTAQESLLFVLEPACHDNMMNTASVAVLKSLFIIIKQGLTRGPLFSHKKNLFPNSLHFLQ